MINQRITIVGLGLMGGSLAKALRPFLSHLTAVDNNPDTLNAVGDLADVVTIDFTEGVRQADLVILATPVRTVLRLLSKLPRMRPDGCMVLDLGSSKTDIGLVMDKLPPLFQAIGGHPMCGKEVAGFSAAVPDLYNNQTFILCRNSRTQPEIEHLAMEIINKIGARPLFLPAGLHDKFVAATSHLPYLLAASLIQLVANEGDDQIWQVSGSGFRDTTRVAETDPHMMLDILLTNKAAVLAQLDKYQDELTAVQQILRSGDDAALLSWLEKSQLGRINYRIYKQNP